MAGGQWPVAGGPWLVGGGRAARLRVAGGGRQVAGDGWRVTDGVRGRRDFWWSVWTVAVGRRPKTQMMGTKMFLVMEAKTMFRGDQCIMLTNMFGVCSRSSGRAASRHMFLSSASLYTDMLQEGMLAGNTTATTHESRRAKYSTVKDQESVQVLAAPCAGALRSRSSCSRPQTT